MKVEDITPSKFMCGIGACPAIFKTEHDTYVVIGRRLDGRWPAALQHRVGPEETLVEVPKELLDALLNKHRE